MIYENFKWRAKEPCVFVYLGEEEKQYKHWIDAEPNDPMPKPSPTFILSEGEMNDSEGVGLNITRRSLFGHLRQYLARFGLATHALFSMRNEGKTRRVII